MSNSHAAPLYDQIGVNYDTTRRADPYLVGRLAHYLEIKPAHRYLDIACGTGNYAGALTREGGDWHGLDLSLGMLRTAHRKDNSIRLVQAEATALPLRDGSFDGAVCTMALHHMASLAPVFREAHRVLRRGRLVIFTSTSEQMAGYWLNDYFPIAMERSARQMPSIGVVLDALSENGFKPVRTELYDVRPDLEDLFLYAGKHRPELYLDNTVRRGISTFSTLADPEELDSGCARLQRDIESGYVREVAQRYRHNGGDYLLIAASKEH